ncbi:MAG: nucleotidyltransferase domain-containing protein [Nanoarchaeota archaeon]|nr:nucleotidyltransferase domain-containing protein [Nanoarchaeota archaeon]
MEFKLQKKVNPNVTRYQKDELDIAYEFAKVMHKEFGGFLKAIVLFGSTARKEKKTADIDILVLVDDTATLLTRELVEAYRIITEKLILNVSKRIHVTSIKLTSFWQYMRAGDPIGINILRDGVPLLDTGIFSPLQVLLYQGRIRPTQESIYTYYERAPRTLNSSKWHMMQGVLDLYWAVIDAAHAALMKHGEIPPTPSHVSDLLHDKLYKTKLIELKYVSIMRNFYRVSKMITHGELKKVSAKEFERYTKEAEDFVERMGKIVNAK